MTTRLLKVGLTALALVALISAPAFAQGGATSSIAGVVTDSGGGVIPGATITATNDRTAGVSTAVSNASGNFTIPALNVGKYTVTVALQGFKTAVLKDVEVTASTPANVKAILEVGGLSETVVVEGASAVIQTQSSAAASTVTTNQIANLPVGSRSTLEFVTFLPGVQTPGGSRDSIVNGLPQSSIAITLDGVSIQDNHLKTGDGFFARLSPRLDAVEEVTLTSAGNGANSSSQGATQIQFTTRSGSNMFTGSAYHYFQHDKLNANSYFNIRRGLPKNQATQYQPGMRVGGPVVIPGIYDGRGKAFFFVNYEESRTPRTINTVSDFLTPEAQAGIFRYTGSDGAVPVGEPVSAGGAERPDVDAGSAHRPAARRHRRVVIAGHRRGDRRQPERPPPAVPAEFEGPDAVPDGACRLQPEQHAPSDRFVVVQRPGLDAGHDQRPRAALPGLPGDGRAGLGSLRFHDRAAFVDLDQHRQRAAVRDERRRDAVLARLGLLDVERPIRQPGRVRPGDRSGRLRPDRWRQLGHHPGWIRRWLLGP